MNQRDEEKHRVWAGKRMKYGLIGMLGGYVVANFALVAAAPLMVSEECVQLQARMSVDGTIQAPPDPATGQLSADQQKLAACFDNFRTMNLFLPIGFMIGGNIIGNRQADKKYKPQTPPQP